MGGLLATASLMWKNLFIYLLHVIIKMKMEKLALSSVDELSYDSVGW